MTREDILHAIGTVDDDRLARCEKHRNPSVVTHREDSQMKIGKHEKTGKSRRIKRVWLIAAIITLMTLIMGCAIAALVSMRVEKVNVAVLNGQNQQGENKDPIEVKDIESTNATEIHEGEKVVFDEVHDVFIELGSYYPQEIPDGYTMAFVSEGAPYQNQSIVYANEAGSEIKYLIFIGDPASSIEIYDIINKTEVDIHGQEGILYEQKGNYRTLVWINGDQGFGFALRTGDSNVDLLAMAESTDEGEYLTPTRSESTVKAVKELGDYTPEYLTDGFVEQGTMGSPLEEGGGWYSYVRKWFVNREDNTQIYFEYESYRIVTEDGYTDDAQTACSFYMPKDHNGEINGEEVEINGMVGFAGTNDVVWADTENHVVFHLCSEDITGDELFKVALSIYNKE